MSIAGWWVVLIEYMEETAAGRESAIGMIKWSLSTQREQNGLCVGRRGASCRGRVMKAKRKPATKSKAKAKAKPPKKTPNAATPEFYRKLGVERIAIRRAISAIS